MHTFSLFILALLLSAEASAEVYFAATQEAVDNGYERCPRFSAPSLDAQREKLRKAHGAAFRDDEILTLARGVRILLGKRIDPATGRVVLRYAYFETRAACEEYQAHALRATPPPDSLRERVAIALESFKTVYAMKGIAGVVRLISLCYEGARVSAEVDQCAAIDIAAATADDNSARLAGTPRTPYLSMVSAVARISDGYAAVGLSRAEESAAFMQVLQHVRTALGPGR